MRGAATGVLIVRRQSDERTSNRKTAPMQKERLDLSTLLVESFDPQVEVLAPATVTCWDSGDACSSYTTAF
jgi:hypothetical protein